MVDRTDVVNTRNVSSTPKLPVEILPCEQQRRWPTVRAVVGIGRQMAQRHQLGDLLRCERVAGANGGVAGHQAHQVIQKLLACRQALAAGEVIDDGPQNFARRTLAEQGGIARDQKRAAAEVLDSQAKRGQRVALGE